MSKVAIVYWSGTGNTETMAKEIYEGVKEAGGQGDLFTAGEFDSSKIGYFDKFAFGCPSMGDEILEESEFEPMYEGVKAGLKGKDLLLFGSYGWGDGQWMRDWEEDARTAGINIIGEPIIANYEPDEGLLEELKKMGASLAK